MEIEVDQLSVRLQPVEVDVQVATRLAARVARAREQRRRRVEVRSHLTCRSPLARVRACLAALRGGSSRGYCRGINCSTARVAPWPSLMLRAWLSRQPR